MQQQELLTKLTLDNWYSHIARTNKLLGELTDEQLQKEIAPGRNRGIYLLGHLAAVHDRMLPLLNLGDQTRPEMDAIFLTSPDKAVKEIPTATELRAYWNEVNGKLDTHFKSITPDEWLLKHNSVSEEDFAKEPHRNRLSIVISRTGHLAGHLGQMILLK